MEPKTFKKLYPLRAGDTGPVDTVFFRKHRVRAHEVNFIPVHRERRLELHGAPGSTEPREAPEKGHATLLRRFVEHARGEGPAPIPLDEILVFAATGDQHEENSRRDKDYFRVCGHNSISLLPNQFR